VRAETRRVGECRDWRKSRRLRLVQDKQRAARWWSGSLAGGHFHSRQSVLRPSWRCAHRPRRHRRSLTPQPARARRPL